MPIAREPIDVLGHTVRPLTVGQVERIETTILQQVETKRTDVQLAREVVKIALARDNAAIDVEDIECTVSDLADAMRAVLRLGGFMPEEKKAPEPAATGSTGVSSEAA